MRLFSRAALENIGRGVLGHSFGALEEEKSTVYSDAIRSLGYASFTSSMLRILTSNVCSTSVLLFRTMFARMFLPYVVKVGTPEFRRRVLDMAPFQAMKDLAKVVDEMYRGSEEVVRKKREAIEKGNEAVEQLVGSGKDIMSILCRFPRQILVFITE